MISLVLAAAAIWIAAGFGRTILGRFSVLNQGGLERFAYAGAIGLGVAAYAVLFIGLFRLLAFWPITILWMVMAGFGWRGVVNNNRDLIAFLRRTTGSVGAISFRNIAGIYAVLGATTLVLVAAIAVIACFKPPTGIEWDAISYHLADPKQFLMEHRVFSLPTEHHSNFPFLMEMLYTVGLLYDGYALANLMHLVTSALTVVAIFAFCRRIGGSTCGWIAVVLIISTPVVLWESTVAYVEMGQALFTTLAVLAAVRGLVTLNISDAERNQWLLLCSVCAGFALGVKYLALVPFGLLFLYILLRAKSPRKAICYAAIALSIGSPWYIKNIVVTHNPVYPYIYKLFPGSVNWSADRAAGYESEQARFGAPHSLRRPALAASNLLQTPWDLLTLPLVHPGTYSNTGEFSFLTLLGGLCFAFNAVTLLRRKINAEVAAVLGFGVIQVVTWFFVAQVSRYLVSVLPLLAISGAYGAAGLLEECGTLKSGLSLKTCRIAAGIAVALLAVQVITLLWIVTFAPPQQTAISLPQIVETITKPDGARTYLTRRLDSYAVTDWINKNTDKSDGVAIYEDTRGFYLDRRYLWANEEHSGYIPYNRFGDGKDLTDWMLRNGYRYAMINMNWSPQNSDKTHPDPELPTGPAGHEEQVLQRWYSSAPLLPLGFKGYRWRGLVADAIHKGLWTDAGVAQHGVMLLRIGPDEKTGSLNAPVIRIAGAPR